MLKNDLTSLGQAIKELLSTIYETVIEEHLLEQLRTSEKYRVVDDAGVDLETGKTDTTAETIWSDISIDEDEDVLGI